jgi:hypothetical protein
MSSHHFTSKLDNTTVSGFLRDAWLRHLILTDQILFPGPKYRQLRLAAVWLEAMASFFALDMSVNYRH